MAAILRPPSWSPEKGLAGNLIKVKAKDLLPLPSLEPAPTTGRQTHFIPTLLSVTRAWVQGVSPIPKQPPSPPLDGSYAALRLISALNWEHGVLCPLGRGSIGGQDGVADSDVVSGNE